MQAIILAAGMGKRLKNLTHDNTKCMVKVNGVTMIARMLQQIENRNFSRIIIVVGYMGHKLVDYINTLDLKTPVEYIDNPIYDKTNNIYSLSLAKEHLCKEDTILFESDLIFEDAVLDALLDDERETLALVDKYESWMDGTCVKLSENDTIDVFIPGKYFDYHDRDMYYKTVNIYKFSKDFSATHYVPFLEAYQKALGLNEYYEQVLRVIAMLDSPGIKAKRLNGQKWYEIDDAQDLDIAESMFAEDVDERITKMQNRYGGYWRYPKLLDFCYLVNPYYPPEKMINELQASFEMLLTQYPSGMRVNSLLAGRNFDVNSEYILVGNGAAELIKALMSRLTGKLGIVRPTFEEYSHRYEKDNIVTYWPENESFRYGVDELIDFFGDKAIDNLIIINPDNPSGNYIEKKDLIRLIEWTRSKSIKLLIDESFADFADETDHTLLNDEILMDNPHLYVIKSISKSYGVPGLRLGVLASGNVETINDLKKDVAIWNINSFAEFYMQIFEKYKKNYVFALEEFRKERARFVKELESINGMKLLPTQANYVMAELVNGMTSKKITGILLDKYNILVKDLSEKMKSQDKQYIRLAIRNTEDNNKLIQALNQELQSGVSD